MDFTREQWQGLAAADQERLARQLAWELPQGFRYRDVHRCELAGHASQIARFEFGEASFALVPGGPVRIGFDPAGGWRPTPQETDSWRATAEKYEVDMTLEEHVAAATTAAREIDFPPMLVETSSQEYGWEPVGMDDPEVEELIELYGLDSGTEITSCDDSIRIRPLADGTVAAERYESKTHGELAADLAAADFRFPTCDEWEFLCGAGTRSLFRWGDHAPVDRYPTDITRAEPALAVMGFSHGPPPSPMHSASPPAGGSSTFPAKWDLHRRPNALGLIIAQDPYRSELVAEIGTTRGGDRGGAICSGISHYLAWLPLATAYFEKHTCRHDPDFPVAQGYTIGRRVLELG